MGRWKAVLLDERADNCTNDLWMLPWISLLGWGAERLFCWTSAPTTARVLGKVASVRNAFR
jgi:hypothetical protein